MPRSLFHLEQLVNNYLCGLEQATNGRFCCGTIGRTDDMELRDPIDAALRAKLRELAPNESELARQIGRNTSWLHKYINGQGHATIDDVVRLLVAITVGVGGALSENETRLLRACRKLTEEDCLDVLDYAEHRARLARNSQSKLSSGQAAHTPPVTKHTKRGTR